ncbi:MAG: ParB/RepB/Spo0J family partition protein [Alphaproteobacteria bacterium]
MSNDDFDVLENSTNPQEAATEKPTGSFGLGSGLDALFGEDDASNTDSTPSEPETLEEEQSASEPNSDDVESDIDALIAQAESQSTPDNVTIEASASEEPSPPEKGRNRYTLPIENLYPSPFQPRKIFNQDSITELASSIAQYGVLQPLLVRKDPKNDDKYEIIAGERRWRASQQARLHELPVVVLEISELEAYKIALIENLQREDIDPIDEAFGYQKLLEDFGQTQEQLAEAVGKSRPHITNTLRLLQLPALAQSMLSKKALTMGHARALIGVDNAEEIAQKVIKQGLSVRQTEKLAAGAKGKTQQKRPRTGSPPANTSTPNKDADTRALENDISNALGMNVTIDSTDGKSGALSVEFKSLDQLDEILHRLAHFPGARLNG